MNRRSLLGFAAATAAMPRAAMAAAQKALLPRNVPTQLGYGYGVSAGEKIAMGEHRARVEAVHREIDRRQIERQFCLSMSDAAKRAFTRRDQREIEQAEGALYGFLEGMRKRYQPENEKGSPERCAGIQSNARRLGL